MAKKIKKGKKKSMRVYEITYPVHGGSSTKRLIVSGRGKKDAAKNAENYMIPRPDSPESVMWMRLDPIAKGIIHSELIKHPEPPQTNFQKGG
jgi:hypothetical protein